MGAHHQLLALDARFLSLASVLAVAAAAGSSPWSAPAPLASCASAPGAPRVVFPSDSPSDATGPGAIVWSAGPQCPGGEGARVASIGAGDVPGPSVVPRDPTGRQLAPRGPLLAGGAPHGQILIAGYSTRAPATGLLLQGSAGGPFTQLSPPGGASAPMALTTAYLGDVALASPPAGTAHTSVRNNHDDNSSNNNGDGDGDGDSDSDSSLRVHVERFFAHSFTRNANIGTTGSSPVQTLTLALDYRGEALAAWTQAGALYTRLLPNHGAPRPKQLLAHVGVGSHVSAVLSDDGHGIVAWTQQTGSESAVYLDRSAAGVRFTAPQLLERFTDPDGVPSPAASPQLVRLSSESVLLAWAGVSAGHWVVRVAPVDLEGPIASSTIAVPEDDALLAGVATGPRDDALVLWSEPVALGTGSLELERQALFAARAFDVSPGRSAFGEVEAIAAAGPLSDASAAIDPASDRAVAVWRGQAGAIEYSLSGPSAGP
jgi:hypothetical protein